VRLRSADRAYLGDDRPGRVQAVRMVEPFIWRRLGWLPVEVDLPAGSGRQGRRRGRAQAARAVLPVGSRELASELLHRSSRTCARRAAAAAPGALKSPLRYRFLAWGRSNVRRATSGRIAGHGLGAAREAQSFPARAGPVRGAWASHRSRGTRGRSVHRRSAPGFAEADEALAELVRLGRSPAETPP